MNWHPLGTLWHPWESPGMYSILLSLKSFISIRKKRSVLWTLHTYWFILLFFSLWQQHVLAAAKIMGSVIKLHAISFPQGAPFPHFQVQFSSFCWGVYLPEVFLSLRETSIFIPTSWTKIARRCLDPVRLWDPTFTNLHYSAMDASYLTKQSLADLAI